MIGLIMQFSGELHNRLSIEGFLQFCVWMTGLYVLCVGVVFNGLILESNNKIWIEFRLGSAGSAPKHIIKVFGESVVR